MNKKYCLYSGFFSHFKYHLPLINYCYRIITINIYMIMIMDIFIFTFIKKFYTRVKRNITFTLHQFKVALTTDIKCFNIKIILNHSF